MVSAQGRSPLTLGAWLPADWYRPLTADEKASVEQSDIDVLLVPENHDTWANRDSWKRAAEEMNTAIYAGFEDDGWTLGLFYDPATEDETVYTKHSSSEDIALQRDDWAPEDYLPTIDIAGIRVGPTICHDHYFSPLMRYQALNDAAALLNLSASPVVRRKWGEVLQARAIENGAYVICTMHGLNRDGTDSQTNKGHVFAFDPFGDPIAMTELRTGRLRKPFETEQNNIYLFTVDPVRAAEAQETLGDQDHRTAITRTRANVYDSPISTETTLDVRVSADQLYLRYAGDQATVAIDDSATIELGPETVTVVALTGKEVFQPERLYALLDVADIEDHRLLIHNHWDQLTTSYLENTVEPVLRARCVEWCSPALVTAPDLTRAYQLANKHKDTHELPPTEDARYPFEIPRAFGVTSTLKPVQGQRDSLQDLAMACSTSL